MLKFHYSLFRKLGNVGENRGYLSIIISRTKNPWFIPNASVVGNVRI